MCIRDSSYTTVETESAVVTARDDESVTLDVTLLNHGERSLSLIHISEPTRPY